MARRDNKGRLPEAPDQRRSHQTRAKQNRDGQIPTREQLVEYLDINPNNASKRDIAKAFGIRGDDRIILKALLKEMEDDGIINRSRKVYKRTAVLPSVTVIEIPSDADPEYMVGHPAKWDDDDGERPGVLIVGGKDAKAVPGPGDRVLARISKNDDNEGPAYIAKPMKVLDAPRKSLIGVVRLVERGARLIPVERKGREMQIHAGDLNGAKDGDLVEVEQAVSGRAMVPKAKVVNVIGNPLSEKAVSLIALHNLEIPHKFPNSVVAESEAAQPADISGREDWRELPFVTIDPATAKDHDDAVYAHLDDDTNNEGGFIVYVAIADVAHYVRPGSDMEREALLRGNSVYFPDRVVPMLPEKISNNLCSLVENQNRAAMGLRMVFNADGEKTGHSFHRVLMRSAAKLSYQQAQTAIDGHPDDKTEPLLEPILKPLFAAFKAMEKAQKKRGPLALDLPERKIILNDDGLVEDVHIPERLTAHKLIEEMMIQSNVCAAETLEQHKVPLLYRVHDAPSQQKLIGLKETLSTMELNFNPGDTVKPEQFNRILAVAEQSDNPHLVNEMILRAQAQAEYTNENYGHFGLNLRRYAHFTSPIRRYADLIVHRALIRALKLGDDGLPKETDNKLAVIGEQISMTERRAMAAERETTDRLLAYFLADQIGARFPGRIAGVIGAGLFVRLDKSGADGFIPASTLGTDYFIHDEGQQALIGERTGERYRIGDQVEVRLMEAEPLAGSLRFEMLTRGERVKPPKGRRSRRPVKKTFGGRRNKR
ncbi:ribonuclease R [Maritalea porphyrae]|uniref:Ribonuclease R n=1 Tax=Maritalea porphyrae TaxID=880732 RepID=A0ABQ5UX98_9HYPH|nr:ribonuclease R [Maritalea porphyrae]GLQ18622.1 ribonuclease R [Maritalea porphyrae]